MSSISLSSISSQITSNIFSKLDSSNAGYIDASTLSSALSGTSGDDVSDLVSTLDSDGDSKITQSELSKGVEELFSQLQSASNQASGARGMPPPPPGGMPPPPPPDGEYQGLTEDEVDEMAASTDDTNLKELLETVSNNFDEVDTDGDGKVTRDEAMTYKQSQSDNSSSSSTSESTSSSQSKALEQIAKLIKSYGQDSSSSSSVTVTA